MKLSWTSLKISIAGAKLSHLVQKDKIWDHGSMAEQARIIFYLVQKAMINGNMDLLKKYLTASCFENLEKGMKQMEKNNNAFEIKEPVINELAVIEVYPSKNNKPDGFTAIITGEGKSRSKKSNDQIKKFSARWSFIRQGDWWLLNEIKTKIIF